MVPRTMRLVLSLMGIAAVVAAFFVPAARTPGGGTTLEGWWTAQLGLALVVAAQGFGRPTRRAFLLAGLFLLGAAAQLGLTAPLWLQHLDLRPSRLLSGTAPIAAGILATQAAVVAWLARSRIAGALAAARSLCSGRAAVVIGAALLLAAAHATPMFESAPSRRLPVLGFAGLIAAQALFVTLHLATLALAVASVHAETLAGWRRRAAAFVALPREDRPPTRADVWLPRILALVVLLAASACALGVFRRVPHVPDEAGYLFQARCFARGELSVPTPPEPQAFAFYLIQDLDGRRFSTTNPGWPAVLALGVRLGAPWLVNPVLGALCVLLAHSLVRRWTDRGTAHLVSLLLATSPWFVFLSASLMTHVLTLALVLAAWGLLVPKKDRVGAVRASLAGLLLGAAVVVRPMDGLVAGVVTGAWLALDGRARIVPALAYSIGCVAGSLPLFLFNAALTGSPTRDPMNVYLDRFWYPGANRLGFGPDVGNVPNRWGGLDPVPGHGLTDVVLNANQNLYNVNWELHGWAVGSLALILAHAAWGNWSSRDRRLGFLSLAVVAGFSCYWFSGGPDFGARYWFLVLVPCLWLTARGAGTVADLMRTRFGVADAPARVGAALALLTFVAIVTFCSWRVVGRYAGYRGCHEDFREMAESGALGRALVLVKAAPQGEGDAVSALTLNPPALDSDGPIFARDLGEESERRLRAAFPGRPVLHALGRSLTGADARIVEAPK